MHHATFIMKKDYR